jgi:hypothetical protein
MRELVDFLRTMTELRSASTLLAWVRAQDWQRIDNEVRLIALHEINAATARLRERQGLAPFEDALPGQPLTLFQIARAILNPSR